MATSFNTKAMAALFPYMVERAKQLNECDNFVSVNVLKYRHDCTNNGVTSRYETLYVPCETGNHTRADLLAHSHNEQILSVIPPAFPGCPYRFRPLTLVGRGSMAGGNFVTGDSRFNDEYGAPISVHDRME